MDIIKVDCKKTRLISDGGCSILEPDNTYSAFLASCNRMYYGIKCDIRFTKDRVIVTSRNRDLRKQIGQKIHISLNNYADLKEMKFGENDLSYLTTLKTVIKMAKRYHKKLCIELHPPIGRLELMQLVSEITEEGMILETKIIAKDLKLLKFIRNLDFNIQLEILASNFSDQLFLNCIKYHLDLNLPPLKLSKDLVDMCHDNRLKVATSNVFDPITALTICETGVDYIYTAYLEEYKPN